MRHKLRFGDWITPAVESKSCINIRVFVWSVDLAGLQARNYSTDSGYPSIRIIPWAKKDDWRLLESNPRGRFVTLPDGTPITLEAK